MNIFKKEPYSKEGYDQQAEQVKETKKEALEHPGQIVNEETIYGEAIPYEMGGKTVWIQTRAEKRHEKALRKLEEMKSQAHEEGLRLETRRNELIESLRRAGEALHDFEKNELGIADEEK